MADLNECFCDPLLEPAPENPVGSSFYITVLFMCLMVFVQAHGCWRIYRNNRNRVPMTVFAFEDRNVHITWPLENEPPATIRLGDDNLQLAIPLDEPLYITSTL
ncbi:hypothetical protein Neosp_005235 [[Neocosmospora] mangrovei]